MDIVCIVLLMLLVIAIEIILELRDDIKIWKIRNRELKENHRYQIEQFEIRISLRDDRVKAQSETIKRLENELSNCKYALYEKDTHNKS